MVVTSPEIKSIGVAPYRYNQASTTKPYTPNKPEIEEEEVEEEMEDGEAPTIVRATPDDYVNMSYISSPFTDKMDLIVGEIPKNNLAASFWKMVWVQSVFLMVAFTGQIPTPGHNTEYFPDFTGPKEFGEFTIEISGSPRPLNSMILT